jgi:hypothetical protein
MMVFVINTLHCMDVPNLVQLTKHITYTTSIPVYQIQKIIENEEVKKTVLGAILEHFSVNNNDLHETPKFSFNRLLEDAENDAAKKQQRGAACVPFRCAVPFDGNGPILFANNQGRWNFLNNSSSTSFNTGTSYYLVTITLTDKINEDVSDKMQRLVHEHTQLVQHYKDDVTLQRFLNRDGVVYPESQKNSMVLQADTIKSTELFIYNTFIPVAHLRQLVENSEIKGLLVFKVLNALTQHWLTIDLELKKLLPLPAEPLTVNDAILDQYKHDGKYKIARQFRFAIASDDTVLYQNSHLKWVSLISNKQFNKESEYQIVRIALSRQTGQDTGAVALLLAKEHEEMIKKPAERHQKMIKKQSRKTDATELSPKKPKPSRFISPKIAVYAFGTLGLIAAIVALLHYSKLYTFSVYHSA